MSEDTVNVAGANGFYRRLHLLALDRSTGEKQWHIERQEGEPTTPVVGNGAVYTATGAQVRAVEVDTGATRWHTSLEGDPIWFSNTGAPALHDGTLFVAGHQGSGPRDTGRLVALDAHTGDTLWTFDAGTGFRAPVVSHGRVYVSDVDGRTLYAVPAKPESPPPLTE